MLVGAAPVVLHLHIYIPVFDLCGVDGATRVLHVDRLARLFDYSSSSIYCHEAEEVEWLG